jgi:hypothetical protein
MQNKIISVVQLHPEQRIAIQVIKISSAFMKPKDSYACFSKKEPLAWTLL